MRRVILREGYGHFLTFLCLLLVVSFSCTWSLKDFDSYGTERHYERVPVEQLKLGMTKAGVIRLLGKPTAIVITRKTDAGLLEVWSYEEWKAEFATDHKIREHWIHFVNDTLVEWGPPKAL
jgi:hypothetical protein